MMNFLFLLLLFSDQTESAQRHVTVTYVQMYNWTEHKAESKRYSQSLRDVLLDYGAALWECETSGAPVTDPGESVDEALQVFNDVLLPVMTTAAEQSLLSVHAQAVAQYISVMEGELVSCRGPPVTSWTAQVTPSSVQLAGQTAQSVNGFVIARLVGSDPGTGMSHQFAGMLDLSQDNVIEMSPGDYAHDSLAKMGGPYGHLTIRAMAAGSVTFNHNPTGGSDTFYLRGYWGPVDFQGLVFALDDRAAFKTESPATRGWVHPYEDITFTDCAFVGSWDAFSGQGEQSWKWLIHAYDVGGSSDPSKSFGLILSGQPEQLPWQGMSYDEHWAYVHGVGSPGLLIENLKIRHIGGQWLQVTNRASENGPSDGFIHVRDVAVEDCCLNAGRGSFGTTFKGHTGNILLERLQVRLGCDDRLHPKYQDQIRGCLVLENTGRGQTPLLTLNQCHFEVGKFFTSGGNSRREVVKLEHADVVVIKDTTIISHPGNPPALLIEGGVQQLILENNTVVGEVIHRGTKYPTYAAFLAAAPAGVIIR